MMCSEDSIRSEIQQKMRKNGSVAGYINFHALLSQYNLNENEVYHFFGKPEMFVENNKNKIVGIYSAHKVKLITKDPVFKKYISRKPSVRYAKTKGPSQIKLISIADIRENFGITTNEVKKWFGDPVDVIQRPCSTKRDKMYSMPELDRISASREFKQFVKEKHSTVSEYDRVETELVEKIDSQPVILPDYTWDELVKESIASRNAMRIASGKYQLKAHDLKKCPRFLAKICLDFIRHHPKTKYDSVLIYEIRNRREAQKAYARLKKRIHDAAREKYPFIAKSGYVDPDEQSDEPVLPELLGDAI